MSRPSGELVYDHVELCLAYGLPHSFGVQRVGNHGPIGAAYLLA